MIFPEDLTQVEDPDGNCFKVYTDLDRLREHMLELSPSDSATINSYVNAAWGFTKLDMLDAPLLSSASFTKRLLKTMTLMKWTKSLRKFAEKFKDPFMRKAFPTIQYDWPDIPTFIHLNMIGNCHSKNYGVPEGGSLEFSKAIARRYSSLGGTIFYSSRVEKILTEGGKAVGIRLTDGTEHRAEIVISDINDYKAIFGLLGGQFVDEGIRKRYSKPDDNMTMGIQVSFGLDRDLSAEPRALVLFLEKPVKIADRDHDRLDLELFGYDPTLAPKGKSVLKVLMNTSYTYWKNLHADPEKYKAAKKLVADTVLQALEKRFENIQEQVVVSDVATPMTMERYTGMGHSYEAKPGFFEAMKFLRGRYVTLPGIKDFYMIGSTVGGAGLPGCAAQGRNLIRELCKKEKTQFTPSHK
jgi:phytoene dehydrogenase-like protein